MWSGAGDGNPGGKRRPEGQGAGGEIREERGRPKKGPGQDGNRAERGSPQERRKEF